MEKIKVEHDPPTERIERMNIKTWPTWSKEVSTFPWTYEEQEICYFLEGDVTVTPEGGNPVRLGKGDLVTFPKGMSCTWDIKTAVRKHYTLG